MQLEVLADMGENGEVVRGPIFDMKALPRVGDFDNDKTAWKRWSFVFKGFCGAASPRVLFMMNTVATMDTEVEEANLSEQDLALDHQLQ